MKRLIALGVVATTMLSGNTVDAQVTFPCVDLTSVTPQTEIPFAGFRDLCDNEDMLPYDGSTSATGLMIDARNSLDLWYDTARYKRYGTYNPPSFIDWEVPDGFDNLWTQVYYAEQNYLKFGHMKYFVSDDGITWKDVEDVSRTEPVSTNGNENYIGYWFMKQESANLDKKYTHFRALYPPPCQSELDNPNVKSCITLHVPDDQKDIYFAPQLGEVVLGRQSTTLSVPTGLVMETGSSTAKVSWTAPQKAGGLDILGYAVYYMEAPPKTTSPDFDTLHGYPFSVVNVQNSNSVIMSGLKPNTVYVVRVAAINADGAGELSPTVYTSTMSSPNAVDELATTCSVNSEKVSLPTKAFASKDDGSSSSGPDSSSGDHILSSSAISDRVSIVAVISSVAMAAIGFTLAF